jgi:hypothetical protein
VSETEERRARFFDYFRERVKTAGSNAVPSTDRLLLVSACLDALAMHWMATSPALEKTWSGERLRRFLLRHGQHDAWSRVSAPRLRDQLTTAPARGAVESRFPFSYYEPGPTGHVAMWKDDPTYADLKALNLIDEKVLAGSSYGGIVYKDLRCGWVHESRPGSQLVQTPLHDELADGEPRYRCDFGTRVVSLILPLSFLVQTAERAVGSFEAEAVQRDIVPYELRS